MRKKRIHHEVKKEGLILTSIVDIALALVIGFIVALPFFFETGIFVSQPSVTKAAPGRETDVKVNILLTNDGNIVLNDERIISKESLTTLLPKLLARSVSKRVIVSSEEKVRYDDVVQILDLAKQSGAANLCLLRQRKK
ncbi:MAG: biopolymer transporter ExbD [candidate division WOR-3 bacterium]|nr:biopolymer transporter ExbD [candidate division WOR-3 bacterium]MDH5683163.1 biopolymer transporter ExbD [candidate division WOR-3 bacterium]